MSGLPLRPLTNQGSQGAINPAAVLIPGDIPGPLKVMGCACQQHQTRKPPFSMWAPPPRPQELPAQLPWHPWMSALCKGALPSPGRALPALQLSLTHIPTCFLTNPFLLFSPFYLFLYKLQSHVKFILIKHWCLSLWVSRKLQSNAEDTLITMFNSKKELVIL